MSRDPDRVPHDHVRAFGSISAGDVKEVVLRSPGGIEASVLTYGAIIRDLSIALPGGRRESMVLGYKNIGDYVADPNYFGAIVGRFANRIARGCYTHDGTTYALDRNERGVTTLHGGAAGFSTKLWTMVHLTETSVTLQLVSPDGDQGFPGEVSASCRYEVSDQRGLVVEVSATTTRPTPVSLAQHSYFTLGAQDVRNLLLTVHADHYTPVDAALIPTGELASVDGTTFDFRRARPVGTVPGGIDHNFVLRKNHAADGMALVATLENPEEGIALDVETTQPGLQVYDGSMIRAPSPGTTLGPHRGICLETQAFPDSPNQPGFPSAMLLPGQTYAHVTTYRFRPILPTSG